MARSFKRWARGFFDEGALGVMWGAGSVGGFFALGEGDAIDAALCALIAAAGLGEHCRRAFRGRGA